MTIGNSAMYVVAVGLPAAQAEVGVARADASLLNTQLMVGFGCGGQFMCTTSPLCACCFWGMAADGLHVSPEGCDLGWPDGRQRALIALWAASSCLRYLLRSLGQSLATV